MTLLQDSMYACILYNAYALEQFNWYFEILNSTRVKIFSTIVEFNNKRTQF